MEKIYIGIDPDVDKSGVAIRQGKEVFLFNYRFFDLYTILAQFKADIESEVVVVIECGYLNKGNWHKTTGSNSVNAQIGQRTGANHETAKKIVEMCEYLDLAYELVRPTKEKKNAAIFKAITGYSKRTNAEVRDAAMLVFGRK